MKILLLQLHRIGDIVLQAPLVSAIQKKYPDAEVHSLINEQFVNLVPTVSTFDKLHLFPRKELQESLVSPEKSIFEAYSDIDSLVERINAESYNIVINLTHNLLSAYLCELLHAEKFIGVFFKNNKLEFSSPWFQHIDMFSNEKNKLFHQLDCFAHGIGIELDKSYLPILPQINSEAVQKITGDASQYIVVQGFTSDEKKNIDEACLASSLDFFHQLNSKIKIVLVGAPFEESAIDNFMKKFAVDIPVQKIICSFSDLANLIQNSNLLLTPDTSVKHLAALLKIPVLEVALGSANYLDTGVYQHNSLIVSSRANCYPCKHSRSCPFPTKLCAEAIPYELLGSLIDKIIANDFISIAKIAKEYNDIVGVHRVQFDTSSFWDVVRLDGSFEKAEILRELKRSSWKIILNGDHFESVLPISGECQRLGEKINKVFGRSVSANMIRNLDFIDEELNHLESSVEKIIRNVDGFKSSIDNNELFSVLESNIEDWLRAMGAPNLYVDETWFHRFQEIFNSENNFSKFRKIYNSVLELKHHTRIQRKIAKTLSDEIMRLGNEKK